MALQRDYYGFSLLGAFFLSRFEYFILNLLKHDFIDDQELNHKILNIAIFST